LHLKLFPSKARMLRFAPIMRTALLIAVASLLCTCARQPSLLEEVKTLGELRVVTRNSPITYYIGPAGPDGPDYELARSFAEQLGVKLKLIEADRFGDLLTEVRLGRAHIAAAGLTVTPERARLVDFGPAYQEVSQHLVYRRGGKRPRTIADLVGKRIEVVANSSYVESLLAARREVPGLNWIENPSADAGELLNRVENGEADYTIVDSNIFSVFQRFHPELLVAFDFSTSDSLAWAFQRRSEHSLIDAAGAHLAGMRASGDLAHLMDRYYGHRESFDYAGTRKFIRDYKSMLPQYRALFEAAGKRADIDWRLIAAVGYQESHWNPVAESPKGALGMMMLTADTAVLMNVEDRSDAVQSITAGSKYLWRMRKRIARLAPGIAEPDLTWMALAAYNMGYGHLLDARRIARLNGGNPDRWVDIKRALPLLMERRWYEQTRWGYARGHETRVYVRNIRNYYDILVWLTEGRDAWRQPEPGDAAPVKAAGTGPAPAAAVINRS
jgi:membrane-bound lytic murein transglycosylase F